MNGAEPPGATLLDDVAAFIARFVALPSYSALTAATLWAAHTHLIACFENTPRIGFLSPEPGSGKTRALEILELVCPEPMLVLNASPPAIFRTIEKQSLTLLMDEVDTVFTRKGKDDENVDLRGLLNSGYRAGATIPRCVGPRHEVQMFPTFCPVALAGLGDLPDTLMTRSVVIRMRRRAPGEHVESFRRRLHREEGEALRNRLAQWANSITERVTNDYPKLPEGITDRAADVWEPLLSVADAAGGEWPKRAREACTELVAAARSTDSGSLGVRLLADLRTVFSTPQDLLGTTPHLFTETILEALHHMPEAPWSDLRGKPLDSRGLANRLRAYGVTSKKVRVGEVTRQGYTREDLYDPWRRYLLPLPAEAEHPEHTEHRRSDTPDSVPDAEHVPEHQPKHLSTPPTPDVPADQHVPEHDPQPEHKPSTLTCTVPDVPLVPDSANGESALNGYDSIETVSAAIGVTPRDREMWARVAQGYDQ